MARDFLDRFNDENGRKLALRRRVAVLEHCSFPGNVRELENCVRRTETLAHGEVIVREDLSCAAGQCLSALLWTGSGRGFSPIRSTNSPRDERSSRRPWKPPPQPRAPGPEPAGAAAPDQSCERAETGDCPAVVTRLTEKERLLEAMERSAWVQAKAARVLGLTPRQIGYALRKYRIEMKRSEAASPRQIRRRSVGAAAGRALPIAAVKARQGAQAPDTVGGRVTRRPAPGRVSATRQSRVRQASEAPRLDAIY